MGKNMAPAAVFEINSGGHHHNRVGAADVKDVSRHPLGDACLLDGETQHGATGKDHKDIPIDGLHGLFRIATAEDEHGGSSKEGTLQQRDDAQRRENHHSNHDACGDKRTIPDVGHFCRVEKMKVGRERGSIYFDVVRA